jgi:hypothetical protein
MKLHDLEALPIHSNQSKHNDYISPESRKYAAKLAQDHADYQQRRDAAIAEARAKIQADAASKPRFSDREREAGKILLTRIDRQFLARHVPGHMSGALDLIENLKKMLD